MAIDYSDPMAAAAQILWERQRVRPEFQHLQQHPPPAFDPTVVQPATPPIVVPNDGNAQTIIPAGPAKFPEPSANELPFDPNNWLPAPPPASPGSSLTPDQRIAGAFSNLAGVAQAGAAPAQAAAPPPSLGAQGGVTPQDLMALNQSQQGSSAPDPLAAAMAALQQGAGPTNPIAGGFADVMGGLVAGSQYKSPLAAFGGGALGAVSSNQSREERKRELVLQQAELARQQAADQRAAEAHGWNNPANKPPELVKIGERADGTIQYGYWKDGQLVPAEIPGQQSGGPMPVDFGNSSEAQAWEHLIQTNQATTSEAANALGGKIITDPSDGSIDFVPASDLIKGQQSRQDGEQPQQDDSAGFELKPPKPDKELKKYEASAKQLDASLKRYEELVGKYGASYLPGQERNELSAVRTDIQMQLKTMYDLGVLNGPDLALMNKMIFDPVVDVTTKDGIMSAAGQVWNNVAGSTPSLATSSAQKLREMTNSALAAKGSKLTLGEPPADKEQPASPNTPVSAGPPAGAPTQQPAANAPTVSTPEQYNQIPPGTQYYDSQGNLRMKPAQ